MWREIFGLASKLHQKKNVSEEEQNKLKHNQSKLLQKGPRASPDPIQQRISSISTSAALLHHCISTSAASVHQHISSNSASAASALQQHQRSSISSSATSASAHPQQQCISSNIASAASVHQYFSSSSINILAASVTCTGNGLTKCFSVVGFAR